MATGERLELPWTCVGGFGGHCNRRYANRSYCLEYRIGVAPILLGLQSRASLLGQRYIIFNTLLGMCVIKHTNLCRRFAKLVRPRPQTIVCFITLPFYTFPLSPGTYHPVGRPHYSRCLECQQGRVPSHLNQFATGLISLQSLPHVVSVV